MDYFTSWCLICDKSIPSDCLYCSEECQFQDFLLTVSVSTAASSGKDSIHCYDMDEHTALRLNTQRIPLNSSATAAGPDLYSNQQYSIPACARDPRVEQSANNPPNASLYSSDTSSITSSNNTNTSLPPPPNIPYLNHPNNTLKNVYQSPTISSFSWPGSSASAILTFPKRKKRSPAPCKFRKGHSKMIDNPI